MTKNVYAAFSQHTCTYFATANDFGAANCIVSCYHVIRPMCIIAMS